MRLIFHGELKKLFGPDAVMEADTVASAIEGFSRQHPTWPRGMRVVAVGYDTVEKLKSWADEVHLMPAMIGGGGKVGGILMGAALIGLSFIPGINVIAAGLATSLLVSGALLVVQGVIGMFMKAPKLNKGADPEASKYLGINKNTTAVGTPITMAWGLIDLHPHWLSLQSDSTNLAHGAFPVNPT